MDPLDRINDVDAVDPPDQWEAILARATADAGGDTADGSPVESPGGRHRNTAWMVAAGLVIVALVGMFIVDRQEPSDGDADVVDRIRTPGTERVDADEAVPEASNTTDLGASTTLADESTSVPMVCTGTADLHEIGELLRSGQPTYDYQPASNVAELIEWSDVVIAGDLVSAQRVATPNGAGYTAFEVANVEVLTGEGAVEQIASPSDWASGQGGDPLAERVAFDGVRFIAFLDSFSDAPGGWAPYSEGFGFGCAGGGVNAESLAGLNAELQDLPIDDVIAEVGVITDRVMAGISRPVFPDDVCPPLSARDFGAGEGFGAVFFPRDEVFPIQIIGRPGGTTADPFALVQRWDEVTDESLDGERVDVVTIGGVEVGIATFDNGNGEATWRLTDGSIGYLRSRGLSRVDLEEIVGALTARPLDAPIPGFDVDQTATDRFELRHESVNTEVSLSGAMSECRRSGDQWIIRAYAINGDPVGRFVAVIDRGWLPSYLVGEFGPTTVIIEGPGGDGSPGVDDVVDADAERFDALTRQPTIAEQDNTPPDIPIGGELEAELDLFDATGSGIPDQSVTLRLSVAEGVSVLEVSWGELEAHPDAAFNVVEITGGGAGASRGGMSTLIDGSTSGFRLGPADATEPFVVTVKIVDTEGRLLQLSPTVRLVPG